MADSLYEEQEPSYYEISAAICLGDKYKITEWYSQSLAYLKSHYPSSFNRWTVQEYYRPLSWGLADALGTVNLTCKTRELSILLSVFIACISPSYVLGIGHGIPLEDGSWEHLSPSNLTICLNSMVSLCTATITTIFRTFKPVVSAECKTLVECKKALHDILVNLGGEVGYLLTSDLFAGYKTYIKDGHLAVCSSCTTMVQDQSLRECKDVWIWLPKLLGIDVPGWGEQPLQTDAK